MNYDTQFGVSRLCLGVGIIRVGVCVRACAPAVEESVGLGRRHHIPQPVLARALVHLNATQEPNTETT